MVLVSYSVPLLSFISILPFVVQRCCIFSFLYNFLAWYRRLLLRRVRSSFKYTDLNSRECLRFFLHLNNLNLVLGSGSRTMICRGLAWPLLVSFCFCLPTLCDLIISWGLKSGSISERSRFELWAWCQFQIRFRECQIYESDSYARIVLMNPNLLVVFYFHFVILR